MMHTKRIWLLVLPPIFFVTLLVSLLPTTIAQESEPRYKTLPDLPPIITHVISKEAVSDGYVFVTPGKPYNDYLLILDNNSEPVYYKRAPSGHRYYDFKKQPDGSLTYIQMQLIAGAPGTVYQMDNTYTVTNSFAPVGYDLINMDEHEFQILPNGNALFLVHKERVVDMTAVITDGLPNAIAVDSVIQEVDSDNNLIFEWDGGDYYDVDDTLIQEDLANATIDYSHGNSLEIDHDGNILLSVRNLSEVTKIDRQTGDMMWRLGGNHNEFTLVGDDKFFNFQHDARRVSADTITIFDNYRDYSRLYQDNSRVVEYRLDEESLTAELVWEYEHPGGVWAWIMANAQRQENGNTMIGWGSGGYNGIRERRMFSEVSADGELLYDVEIKDQSSYRAFRFDWEGHPTEPPMLVAETEGNNIELYYSWNGATEVASYNIYNGVAPDALSLIGTKQKTGFEEGTLISDVITGTVLYYQIAPVDAAGNELTLSNIVTASITTTTAPTAISLSTVQTNPQTTILLSLSLLSVLYLGIVAQKVGRKR